MNYCNDRHESVYKIKYKPIQLGAMPSEWLVCEHCFGKEEFFGAIDEIESIVSLRNFSEIRLDIDHLLIMTRTISKKLKKILSKN